MSTINKSGQESDDTSSVLLPVTIEHERTTSRNDADVTPSVDKIRDIIFGGQMRDYETRFAAIDARINKETARLRQDMEDRMDSLENLVLREFETLTNKLQLEKKERGESLLSTEALLKKNNDFLAQRLTELENKALEEIRKLRTQEYEDIKTLRDSIHTLRQELSSQLEKDIDHLRKTKVDKASVAALFSAGNN